LIIHDLRYETLFFSSKYLLFIELFETFNKIFHKYENIYGQKEYKYENKRMPGRTKICTAKNIITEYMGTKQICFQQLDKYKYDNTNSMVLTMISKIGRVQTWKQTEWVSQK
jgi:hypothetical protein